MSKLSIYFVVLIVTLIGFLQFPQRVSAGNNMCTQTTVSVDKADNYSTTITLNTLLDINSNQPVLKGTSMTMNIEGGSPASSVVGENGLAIFKTSRLIPGQHTFTLAFSGNIMCNRADSGAVFIVPDVGQGGSNTAGSANIEISPNPPQPNNQVTIRVKNLSEEGIYFAQLTPKGQGAVPISADRSQCTTSNSKEAVFTFAPLVKGTWVVTVMKKASQDPSAVCMGDGRNLTPSTEITISLPVTTPVSTTSKGCTGSNCTSSAGIICDISNGERGPRTNETMSDFFARVPKERHGVLTAIGCVPTEPTALIQGILKFAVGAGGGIALLLMVFGAFQMITSSGNPEGVKKGHEMMTSAVIGLLFIVFSTLLLKVIGVDILNIPGFTP